MRCYWCKLNGGFVLKEAADARWLTKDTLFSVPWLPADINLVKKIEGQL